MNTDTYRLAAQLQRLTEVVDLYLQGELYDETPLIQPLAEAENLLEELGYIEREPY